MKKLLIAGAVAASSVSMAVTAESKFEGFSLELGGASVDYSVQFKNVRNSATPTDLEQFKEMSSRESFVDAGLKYTFKMSPKLYLAMSYERTLGDADLGKMVAASGQSDGTSVAIDNLESFVIAPSYVISDQTLASVRIGYIRNDLLIKNIDANDPAPAEKFDQNGYSLGFGAQHFITDNIYVGGSFDMTFYDDKTYTTSDNVLFDLDTDATKLRLNVGYRF